MQECWYDKDILMYSTPNEGKLEIVENFIKKLNVEMYSKSYLADINKLVDEYNDTDHYSINNRTY